MNDLDKLSEKILRQIIKHNSSLRPNDFGKIKQIYKYSNAELNECLTLLEQLHYISHNTKDETLVITFRGKQYFLLKRKFIVKNLIFNFVIPLIIAIITAYITAKLTTTNEVTVLINTNQII